MTDWIEHVHDVVLEEKYDVGCNREGGVCQGCIDSIDTPDLYCAGCDDVTYKHEYPDLWIKDDISNADI